MNSNLTPESIDPLNRSAAGVMLMNAIAAAAEGTRFEEVFIDQWQREHPNEPVMVDVVLTVNGVQVPFLESVNDGWKTLEQQLDKMILEKAYELCTGAGLDSLMNEIQNAEWKIRDALSKVKGD
jgi:hypothetical protein